MSPHRRAGGQVVARHHLVVAALLLGIDQVAVDREGRPARPDRPAPQFDGLRPGPISFDPHAANDAVALRSTKAGPVSSGLRSCGICPALLGRLGGGSRRLVTDIGRIRTRRFNRRGCRSGRDRRRLCLFLSAGLGLGEETLLGSRRPPPVEI